MFFVWNPSDKVISFVPPNGLYTIPTELTGTFVIHPNKQMRRPKRDNACLPLNLKHSLARSKPKTTNNTTVTKIPGSKKNYYG